MDMRQCIECGVSFAPYNSRHKFCSSKCQARFKMRRRRLRRQERGLCPQCGGPMDYPVRIRPDRSGKQKISYCSRCREKWRRKG